MPENFDVRGDEGLSSHLYIHVPFCERKCNYCAFESAVPRPGQFGIWLSMLSRELELRLKGRHPKLDTCYIGGGTPTVLGGMQWRLLTEIIDRNFDFEDDAEVTVEANPNSMKAEHLLEWRDWRVTRVSIGVQSFDDAELLQMGRLHDARQAREAISSALASGFAVSADFMFGLPHQSFANWGRTLREAVRCGLSHISLYQLAIEEGTPWANIDQETLGDGYAAYRWSQIYLPLKGYEQYEIANFARPGCESRHNINYWQDGSYIGAGPGASSYLGGVRSKNYGSLERYARCVERGQLPTEESERLPLEKSAREAAVLALRMSSGIDFADFRDRFGKKTADEIINIIKGFPPDLYNTDEKSLSLTKKGMRVANRIWEEIV